MDYDTILFDLDGTLIESAEGIVNAAVFALEKMQIKEIDRKALLKFVGPPLADSFKIFYQMNDADVKQAVIYFREYYEAKGIFENQLYDGISDLLFDLNAAGKQLAIATSKTEQSARIIAHHFKIDTAFKVIAGATRDQKRSTKSEVIAYCLEQMKSKNIVMIGDRKFDMIGAKANHLKSIGVLYGYGNREELKAAHADHIISSVAQLRTYLI